MKRAISFLLVLVMVMTLLPVSVFAAGEAATFTVGNASGEPGSTVDVDITVANNPGILSTTLSFTFDKGLTLVSATPGKAFEALPHTFPAKLERGEPITGTARFMWQDSDITDAEIKDGVILTLTFALDENAEVNKDYKIAVECIDCYDRNTDDIATAVESGYVSIIDYTPGDVTADKNITTKDVIWISRYIVDGCTTDPEGYNVSFNELAADVTGDGAISTKDVIWISRYIVDGCMTDPDGYNVKLFPGLVKCAHEMETVPAKAATCTEDGNIAYWYCNKCDKYFSDAAGKERINYEDVIIPKAEHNIVVIPAVEPNEETGTDGRTEGRQCSVCGFWEVEPVPIPVENTKYAISYSLYNVSDPKESSLSYLKGIDIENPNPTSYSSKSKVDLILHDPVAPGYDFDGWYDKDGKRIYAIEAGTAKNLTLFARWTEHIFNITYNLYKTPADGGPKETEYKNFKVSQGNYNLYNPKIYNYVFLGWFDSKGKEYKNVPIGTADDVVLNAYYTSKRNLATSKVDTNPIILEDRNENVVYFTYEIGEIKNIPLTDNLWEQGVITSVAGLKQLIGTEYIVTEDKIISDTIANTITDMSTDSKTWTLAEDWNEVISNNETCSQTHEEGHEDCKTEASTSSNTFSLTTQDGGSSYHKTEDGTTVYDYDSKTVTKDKGHTVDVSLSGTYANKMSANLGNSTEFGAEKSYSATNGYTATGKSQAVNWSGTGSATQSDKDKFSAGISYENGFEINAGVAYGYHNNTNTVTKTGSDSVSVNSDISENTSNWNNTATSSSTNSHSLSTTVRNTLSDIISTTKQYGQSYSHGGQNSETQGFSNTKSDTTGTSSTVTYSKIESRRTYSEISTDGMIEGKYRLVLAGTAHVFGVVGYDYNTKSYFTYTFSVMDDKTDLFVDYSPDTAKFDDQENSCVPFEVPIDIYSYVNDRIALTDGIKYDTNSTIGTAMVTSYNEACSDVIIPSYISDGKQAYKVTEISPSAFAGTSVKNVVLGEFIKSIPNGAFKNCTSLEGVIGSFTEIGDEAFSGCTKLTNVNIPSNVVKIGASAFLGVNSISVRAVNSLAAYSEAVKALPDNGSTSEKELDEKREAKKKEITQEFIKAVLESGARNITLDLSQISVDTLLNLDVPAINSLEIRGANKEYENFVLKSDAKETALSEITINSASGIPLTVNSDKLTLNKVVVNANSVALVLKNDGEVLSLVNDSEINSPYKYAVIAKNPVIDSVTENNIDGTLRISGNFGYVNSVQGKENAKITNGDYKEMTEDEFKRYIQGFYTINYDAGEGSLEAGSESMQVMVCDPIENMPVPTRDYYTLDGWYTKADEKVSEGDKLDVVGEITLYAHWTPNPVVGWTAAENVPDDAEIAGTKWTYTQTTTAESTATSLSGYTPTGNYWRKTGDGSFYYASFPNGFDTGNWYYTNWNRGALSSYENETAKRDVSTWWSGWIYWHWMYDTNYAPGTSQRAIFNRNATASANGYYYKFFGAFDSSTDYPYGGTGYTCNLGMDNYIVSDRTAWDYCQGATRWFRFNFYTCAYTDYQKIFQYRKVENLESVSQVTEGTSGNVTISNVNKWVMWRPRTMDLSVTEAGSSTYNGHTYILYTSSDPVAWEIAKKWCEKNEGYLACVSSAEENTTIGNLVNGKHAWLGGYRDDALEWAWVSGEAFLYSDWRNGEPTNSDFVEWYLHYHAENGWNDISAMNTRVCAFVLERDGE